MASRFENFTYGARRTLQLAEEEAQRLFHDQIGTDHLILGLIGENRTGVSQILSRLGVDLPKCRSMVELVAGKGVSPTSGEIVLEPQTKKVIELAVAEARLLSHDLIGTVHLLIGILREEKEEDVGAAGVLASLGVSLDKVMLALGNLSDAELHDQPTVEEAMIAQADSDAAKATLRAALLRRPPTR